MRSLTCIANCLVPVFPDATSLNQLLEKARKCKATKGMVKQLDDAADAMRKLAGHARDHFPEGTSIDEIEKRVKKVVKEAKDTYEAQDGSGRKIFKHGNTVVILDPKGGGGTIIPDPDRGAMEYYKEVIRRWVNGE